MKLSNVVFAILLVPTMAWGIATKPEIAAKEPCTTISQMLNIIRSGTCDEASKAVVYFRTCPNDKVNGVPIPKNVTVAQTKICPQVAAGIIPTATPTPDSDEAGAAKRRAAVLAMVHQTEKTAKTISRPVGHALVVFMHWMASVAYILVAATALIGVFVLFLLLIGGGK